MSHCSLIPKSFAQIGSAQSLCASNGAKCENCAAPSANSTAFSTSTYMGSGYRSVAFGTWAVGDASRCFKGQRRGKSATALENGRVGRTTKNDGEKENGRGGKDEEEKDGREGKREGKEEAKGNSRREREERRREEQRRRRRKGGKEEEREKRKRHRNKSTEKESANGAEKGGEGRGGANRAQSDSFPSADRFRLSSLNFRSVPTATDHGRQSSPTLSRSLGDISAHRKTMQTAALMRRREPDLYSSSEYVRHNNGPSGRAADIWHEKVAAFPAEASLCSSPASSAAAAFAPLPNGGCSLEALFVPPLRCPVPLSPCPSRTSCPPAQRPLRRLLCPKQNNWSPHSLCQSPLQQQQQFSYVIDPLAKEMPRMRTKSLDNGLKLSLGTVIRRRKDRICEGVPAEFHAENGLGSRKSAICESDLLSTCGTESRLEAAKNFLRRFYNHSTLRLTGRRRRRVNGTKRDDADKGTAEPPLMYSSALGPFFEMRKPQPEEVPFLPYNIHYTIESTDEASGTSDDEKDNAVAPRRPLRPVSPQSEWSCTPTCSSATITTSPNRAKNSSRNDSCKATTANRQNTTKGHGETYQHHQQHNQQPQQRQQQQQQKQRHQQQQLALIGSGVGQQPHLPPPVSPFFVPFVPNSVLPMAPPSPISPSSPQHFVLSSPPHHHQSTTDSLLNETVATTPSVGYGSLKSSSDSSEGRRDNDGTATERRRMGPAEKRFADWNELFQYLKREIVEMNVRDAQILRRLEGIRFELNGVRQMSAQQRR